MYYESEPIVEPESAPIVEPKVEPVVVVKTPLEQMKDIYNNNKII